MKRVTALISAAIAVSLLPVFSAAGENIPYKTDSDYFTVKSEAVTFTVTDTGKEALPEDFTPPSSLRAEDKAPIAAAAIVNGGLQAWGVINSAKPDGSANTGYANAMPNWVDWNTISGWKGPKEVVYSYTVTNLMSIDVIKVKYKISFFYGGSSSDSNVSFEDCLVKAGCLGGAATCPDIAAKCAAPAKGKGRYISNLKVTPLAVDILWGFKFDLDCLVSNPMNIGTLENPLAYLQTDLMWSISTPLKKSRGVWTYSADGNGNFKDLTAEEKALAKGIPAPVVSSAIPSVSWD